MQRTANILDKICGARAARLFMLFQPMILLFCGFVVVVAVELTIQNMRNVKSITQKSLSAMECVPSVAGSLKTVPTNSKVFLCSLLSMREKQILRSVTEIQKENWG